MERNENQERSTIFLLILSLLGATINALILLCIQRNPLNCFRNSSSYLVAHQAFSDMVTCLFIAGYYIAFICDGSTTEILPTIPKLFVVLSMTGFIALFLVSLDRFLAIRFPIRYRIHVKPHLIPVLIVPIWLCALITILLIAFKPPLYNTISMFLAVLGSILIFIKLCLHCLTFWTIKKKDSEIRSQSSSNENQQLVTLKRERKFLFTVFLITVVVLVTTVPLLCAFYLKHSVGFAWRSSGVAVFAFYWLGVIVGPCIYFIRLKSYYASLRKIICF